MRIPVTAVLVASLLAAAARAEDTCTYFDDPATVTAAEVSGLNDPAEAGDACAQTKLTFVFEEGLGGTVQARHRRETGISHGTPPRAQPAGGIFLTRPPTEYLISNQTILMFLNSMVVPNILIKQFFTHQF